MSKFVLLLCIAFLAIGVVTAQEAVDCKPGGVVCSTTSECCEGLICNPWAGRCTKPRTTTAAPTTAEPTTAAPTTAEPTTAAPTTAEPTTAAPSTEGPVGN